MRQKRIKWIRFVGIERFCFLQKQKVAKTLAKIRTSCGFYVFGLLRSLHSLAMTNPLRRHCEANRKFAKAIATPRHCEAIQRIAKAIQKNPK